MCFIIIHACVIYVFLHFLLCCLIYFIYVLYYILFYFLYTLLDFVSQRPLKTLKDP